MKRTAVVLVDVLCESIVKHGRQAGQDCCSCEGVLSCFMGVWDLVVSVVV